MTLLFGDLLPPLLLASALVQFSRIPATQPLPAPPLCVPCDMAYTRSQDWATDDWCLGVGSDGGLHLSEGFLIEVLLSLEWLVFAVILGFLTFQIILQTVWTKRGGAGGGSACHIAEAPAIDEELQQGKEVDKHELYEDTEDGGFELHFSDHFYEDLAFMEYFYEEDSGEEEEEEDAETKCLRVMGVFLSPF